MSRAQQKALVRYFLERCNAYADAKIVGYTEKLETAAAPETSSLARKIDEWTVYRRFNEHAIEELATAELDPWFDEFKER